MQEFIFKLSLKFQSSWLCDKYIQGVEDTSSVIFHMESLGSKFCFKYMYNIKTLCYKFCLLYFNCIIFLYFSALDAESEYLVHEALERLMVGRTVITIAHRLSTIKSADQIAVIDNGQVSEIGSYGQLMEIDNGLFRKLVERQTITR